MYYIRFVKSALCKLISPKCSRGMQEIINTASLNHTATTTWRSNCFLFYKNTPLWLCNIPNPPPCPRQQPWKCLLHKNPPCPALPMPNREPQSSQTVMGDTNSLVCEIEKKSSECYCGNQKSIVNNAFICGKRWLFIVHGNSVLTWWRGCGGQLIHLKSGLGKIFSLKNQKKELYDDVNVYFFFKFV